MVCSVAKEPDFKEWAAKTKVYDEPHDPVRFNSPEN